MDRKEWIEFYQKKIFALDEDLLDMDSVIQKLEKKNNRLAGKLRDMQDRTRIERNIYLSALDRAMKMLEGT